MRGIYQRISRSAFIGRVFGLTSATVVAQAIGMLNLVIIGKAFPVEEFGLYQIFISYCLIAAPVVLLGYHLLFPHIAQKEYLALVSLAVYALPGVSIALAGILLLSGVGYALAYPAYILGLTSVMLAEMINIRSGRFRLIAVMKLFVQLYLTIWLAMFLTSTDLPHTSAYLIFPHALGFAVIAQAFVLYSLRGQKGLDLRNWRASVEVMWARRKNPFFVMPANLMNILTYNLPIILLERYWGPAWSAYYSVVVRFCFAPIALLADPIGKVYQNYLANAAPSPRLKTNFLKLSGVLLSGGLVIGALIYFFFGAFIVLFIGPEWTVSGEIAQILSPMFAVMFFVAPLTVTFFVFDRQFELFVNQLAYLIIVLLALAVGIYQDSPMLAMMLFSVLSVLRYLAIYAYVGRLTSVRARQEESD